MKQNMIMQRFQSSNSLIVALITLAVSFGRDKSSDVYPFVCEAGYKLKDYIAWLEYGLHVNGNDLSVSSHAYEMINKLTELAVSFGENVSLETSMPLSEVVGRLYDYVRELEAKAGFKLK